MSESGPKTFTCRQIAAALSQSKRWILRVLAEVPESAVIVYRGQEVKAWTFDAMPADLKARLSATAEKGGFRDAEAMLLWEKDRWAPDLPIPDLHPDSIDAARKLQRALAHTIERMDDAGISAGELERMGCADFDAEFGYKVTPRHWRHLWRRTLDRDRGFEEWDRIEIYLPDRVKRKSPSLGAPTAAQESQFAELVGLRSACSDPANPTPADVEWLWTHALEWYRDRAAGGGNPRRVKQSLIRFLKIHFFPEINTMDAMRVAFSRRLARLEKGETLADRRRDNGRAPAAELSQEDRDKLIAHARVNCRGMVSMAFREMVQAGKLPSIDHLYIVNPSRKSYVPHRIRSQVQPDVKMLDAINRGPRTHQLAGPYVERDWSETFAGEWYQADDVTMPILYYEMDDTGCFDLMRGQVLVMIDLRSTRILGHVLISAKAYDSLRIRTLITKVADQYGLPSRGFYFERGIWSKSRLLKGRKTDCIPISEVEGGLGELGLRFIHAKLPRTKPVERVIGEIQNLAEGLPGNVGRNEILKPDERLKEMKLAIEAGKLDVRNQLFSAEQWSDHLEKICQDYNRTPQDGKMLDGLSPDEAWVKHVDPQNPQAKLGDSCRHLLAHHRIPVRVTMRGISFRIGKHLYRYIGEATGPLIGQQVLAWFNPDLPDLLPITDMSKTFLACVKRLEAIPATTATEDQMAEAHRAIAGHQAHAIARYRVLKPMAERRFRPVVADRPTLDLGQQIATATRQNDVTNRRAASLGRRIDRATRQANLPTVLVTGRDEETASALDELRRLKEKHRIPDPAVEAQDENDA